MPNFVSELQAWNTRPIWRSCKRTSAAQPLFSILILTLSLTLSLPVTANVEALACGEALAQPLPGARAGLDRELQVLIWNIQKAGNSGWDSDLGTIGANSDLLLIQEASVQAMIADALPQPLYQAFAAGYINNQNETGVLTLSAVEPSLHCNLTAWEPWLGTPKATNITEYPIEGIDRRLLVINLHAVNFSVGLEDFELQVKALEPLLSRHIGPVIAAGDFNTWSDNRTQSLHDFMTKHQLASVPFQPDDRTRFWNSPLDHVYLRGLNLVQASTIKVESSDHNPLLITVEIPQCLDCTAQSLEQSCSAC